MDKNRTRQSSIVSGMVASLLAALVVAGLTYFAAKVVQDQLLATFLAALVGAGVVAAAIRMRVINPIEFIGARYLDTYTGIVKVYPSLLTASEDLIEAFSKARRIDLLLHIGRREFGSDSLLYHILRQRVDQPDNDLQIRILHISEDSPYLSENRAKELGKRRQKWLIDVRYVRARILEAARCSDKVRLITHNEPFVWRMFFFDDTLFVSSYLHSTKNDEYAPVFLIHQGAEGTNSLFSAFQRYYNHLWNLNSNGGVQALSDKPEAGNG